MSSDYTDSKIRTASPLPEEAIDGQEWTRYEPVLTVQQLKERFLFGIPLYSRIVDPITKKPQKLTDEMLKDQIMRAITKVETKAHIDVFPVKRREAHDFDRSHMDAYGYFQTKHKPVYSVDKLEIKPGNTLNLYEVPNEWVDSKNFRMGRLHIIPLTLTMAGGTVPIQGRNGAAIYLQAVTGARWIPSFWQVEYTSGFGDGLIPRILNELIGIYAAIEILSLLAPTNNKSSQSLGLDGMSQSSSGPGPEVYNTRLKKLEEDKKDIMGALQVMFGIKFPRGNI